MHAIRPIGQVKVCGHGEMPILSLAVTSRLRLAIEVRISKPRDLMLLGNG